MKYYHTSLRDIVSCNWFRKGTRLLPRLTVSILIPFLQEKLYEYDIEEKRINLRYADGCLTKYDDVQTVFINPNEITKHFDGVLIKKDYHATHYILSKHLYPKQFKVASDNQFSVMFNFHGQDCGATSQKELQSKMGSKGQKEIFQLSE